MKNFRALALLTISISASAFATEKVAVADLVKDPAKFDGKVIKVTGKVVNFQQKTSKKGNAYFTFVLNSGGKTISIYGQGKLENAPKNDANVEAIGKFAKETKVGTNVFKNELNVTKKKDDKATKDFGVTVKS